MLYRFDFIFKFTKYYKQECEAIKILNEFADNAIQARRNALQNNNEIVQTNEENAPIDLLLKSTSKGDSLTDKEIRDEINALMAAGHDATSAATSFVLYNLAMHPEIQQQVYNEVISIIGDDPTKRATMQELNKLSYLDMVIKETLRMFPPVSVYGRKLKEDLIYGNYHIPKHTDVYVHAYLMGRDSNNYQDPDVFNPLRFESKNDNFNPFSLVAFSAGPRICAGQKFAILSMKSSIAKIIRNFELTISKENEKLNLAFELVLRPTNGIILKFNERISR